MYLELNPYDVIALTETWLDKDYPSGFLLHDEYYLERRDRPDNPGGGIGCYLRKKMSYIRRNDLEDSDLEIMWIEIKIKCGQSYFLGINYRPPQSNSTFFDKFECNIEKVLDITNNVVIVGDLNCNMLTTNPLSLKVHTLCDNLQLNQNIAKPTRVTPHSKTLIDLIFTSNNLGRLQSGVQTVSLSDHSLVYVVLKEIIPKSVPRISHFRSFHNFNVERFLTDIEKYDWNCFYNNEGNVEDMWREFKRIFIEVSDKHAPYVSVRKKMKRVPWITEEYLQIAKERDFNHKQFDKTK